MPRIALPITWASACIWVLASTCAPQALAHSSAHTGAHSSASDKHAMSSPPEQTAWGIAGQAQAVTRTITVRMSDNMRFSPGRITVHEGETVRLHIINQGKLLHELVLGDDNALKTHAEWMKKFPNMEHDEPHMAHVSAGKAGQIVWHFNRAGEFRYACLIAGHYDAGMIGTLVVLPRTSSK